jgi:hypothetical protein
MEPEKEKQKMHLFTYRHDKEEWLRFVATATLHDTTPTDIFKSTVKEYLDRNQAAAAKKMAE